MYPDLKKFRNQLNSEGGILHFYESLFIIGCLLSLTQNFLKNADFNNVFPWFIEYLLIASIISQGFYFYQKLKLEYKNEKEKIKFIVDINNIKKIITPFLFLKLQLRYFIFLRIPYFLIIEFFFNQVLALPSSGFEKLNLTQNLFFYILHISFLIYDYFSFRETIDKLSTKLILLTPDINYSKESGYNSSANLKAKNMQLTNKKTQLKNKKMDKKDAMLKKFLDK